MTEGQTFRYPDQHTAANFGKATPRLIYLRSWGTSVFAEFEQRSVESVFARLEGYAIIWRQLDSMML